MVKYFGSTAPFISYMGSDDQIHFQRKAQFMLASNFIWIVSCRHLSISQNKLYILIPQVTLLIYSMSKF